MKLIKPYYKIEDELDGRAILQKIEKAGRTCYKSEDRITDESAGNFVKMLLTRGHESVLEHVAFSVRFICDRGVSHELVRHRLASFSQESTRYCNYGNDEHITFIIPNWLNPGIEEVRTMDDLKYWCVDSNMTDEEFIFLGVLLTAEISYQTLIKNGWKPEQARSILPNCLKTEIVVSANLREWRHILTLRASKAAHPQMRELMVPLLKELKEAVPVVFEDIEPYE